MFLWTACFALLGSTLSLTTRHTSPSRRQFTRIFKNDGFSRVSRAGAFASPLAIQNPTVAFLSSGGVVEGLERAKPLQEIQRYRGAVDEGYGRGGKKLGVPTANLPASLFQNALENVPTGVYFGWAALEHLDENPFKAVVNVGFSPTFEGKENPEKIIEAHLIVSDDAQTDGLEDFYGQSMRLQLVGWLRDEKKFDSFPDLIAQIQADVRDAKDALDLSSYADMQDMSFLNPANEWIGSGGGDASASWEFASS